MNFPTSLQHHNLYPNQWIKNSWVPFGWKIIFTILLTFYLISSTVNSQNVDYLYHNRVYRQNILSGLKRQNQPVVVDPSVDDYTVDNYEKTRFKFRSSDNNIGAGDYRISNQGVKGNGDYTFGLDDSYSTSPLDSVNSNNNENLQRLHQEQPQVVNQNGDSDVSSFFKSTPLSSSQLKAPSFHVDSSQPMTMYTRTSSLASARIHTDSEDSVENLFFVGSVIGVTFVGIFLVVATGYFVHRINIQRRAAADVEYPAYGVVGPGASLKEKESLSSVKSTSGTSKGASGSGTVGGPGSLSPSGDRRLAQSAQMYHYHHQKQQMISSDKLATEAGGQHPSTSEVDSEEEENEEGDYTVYECPGLASTGELEVKNPLFQDDITPISSPSVGNSKQAGN
ncbi:protein cab-1-like [Panonychus citri]|uniref:protein cab-1-like n=1 Tax=Panonychus citri TaxID=50023 RepID=UPI002306E0B1|nr:protein cab-1-like [Panonychus citri]